MSGIKWIASGIFAPGKRRPTTTLVESVGAQVQSLKTEHIDKAGVTHALCPVPFFMPELDTTDVLRALWVSHLKVIATQSKTEKGRSSHSSVRR